MALLCWEDFVPICNTTELLQTSVQTWQTVLMTCILIVRLLGVIQLPGYRDLQTSSLLSIIFGVIWSHWCVCVWRENEPKGCTVSQNSERCRTNNKYWTNCAFGLYPSSGVSKIEELKIYTKYHNTHVHKIHTRVNY